MIKDFEIISHTADLQIRVYGKTLKDLFKNALIGMFQSIKPISDECKYENEILVCKDLKQIHEIELTAPNTELLLIDFLSEALYLSDINNEVYLDAEIYELAAEKIKAKIFGIKIQGFEVVEIKAVTYHDFKIKKEKDFYIADIVFDI